MVRRNLAPRLAGALLSFAVFIFDYLAFKSTEIWNSNRFPDFSKPITTRGRGLFYITDPSVSTKNTSNRVRVLPLLTAALPS